MKKNNKDSIIEDDELEITEYEYDTSYQGSVLQELMKEARKYPILSSDKQKELAVRAQKGDADAQNALVNHNIRLILSRANRFYRNQSGLDLMDLFQEGSFGIIRAIQTYDYTVGAFSTYAITWIDQAIDRAINNKKDTIRIPVHIKEKIPKYNALIAENEKYHLPPLSDEEICQELKITKDTLRTIRDTIKLSPLSLDEKIKDDSDTSRENFVPYYENGFDQVESSMVRKDTFGLVNFLLKPHEFYIIYYRILANDQLTLEEVGAQFNITRERIRQIENKALKKIKPYFGNDEDSLRRVARIKNETSAYRAIPTSIDNIILYLILSNKGFNSYQRYIFYELFLSQMLTSDEKIAAELHISFEDYTLLKKDMMRKTQFVLSKKEQFEAYKKLKISEYGTKIFETVTKPVLEKDYHQDLENLRSAEKQRIKAEEKKSRGKRKYVRKIENFSRAQAIDDVLDLSFEDFCQTYDLSNVRPKQLKQLKSFFEFPIPSDTKADPADIYMEVLGYNKYSTSLPPKVLYKTYKEHLMDFTEEQRCFLECYLFGTKPIDEFLSKYPNSPIITRESAIFDRLDAYHYNVNCFKDNSFTKAKWLEVKKKHPELFTPERIKYLDMYYGVNQKPKTISQIAAYFKMDLNFANDKVSDARDRAIVIYNNRFNTLDIDNALYIPMIHDYRISFVPRTRQILIWFLEEGKTYKEIAELTGISVVQVSNIVTDAIRKLDNVRYGITSYTGMAEEDLEKFFEQSQYTDIQKAIIRDRKVNDMPLDEATLKYGMPKFEINSLISHFYNRYEDFISKDIEFTNEDVLAEINKEPYESILTQQEKDIMAFVLGIKCKYNRKGEKISYAEFGERFHLTRHKTYQMYYATCKKIKLIKLGYLKHDLITIPRDTIIEALKDERLPISDKEKDIISRIYGLNAIHETPKQIAEDYKEKPASILRRYQRALVTILKYKEGLIEGKLIFDKDIVPILKYFPKFDRIAIKEFYGDQLSFEQIAENHGLTFNRIVGLKARIEPVFLEILHNPDGNYFDFDYFDKVIDNPDIPFKGDKNLVKEMFNLYTGNSGDVPMSIPQIIKHLNLDINNSVISKAMTGLMVSVCKYRDGIKLKYLPTYEEVRSYYDNHKEEMTKEELSSFLAYFKTHRKKVVMEKISVPDKRMLYLLLKEKYPDLYDTDTASKESVINLIKAHHNELDEDLVKLLQSEYGIMNRELLSEEDYEKMRKLIVSITNKHKIAQTRELTS